MTGIEDNKSKAAKLSSKLWLQAKKNLSEDDQKVIQNFNREDNHGIVNKVLALAKEKKKGAEDRKWAFKRKDGSLIVVRDVFDKIIGSITKFQDAVNFLVSMDASGHAALPWAGVKFFLSVAVKDSKKWASVIEGMEFVTREISYYSIFEVIYLQPNFYATEELSNALVGGYTKILQYLSGARRYYQLHFLERFLNTALSLDEDLSGIVQGIKNDRENIERLRGTIDGQRIMSLSEDQKRNQEKLVRMLDDLAAPWKVVAAQLAHLEEGLDGIYAEMRAKEKADQLPKIYNHLKPGEMTNYETKVRDLTPGTATWILETTSFSKWADGKISVLVISGGPGTGKSHLSTKVIDYLRQRPIGGSHRRDLVGYYYFNDRNKSSQSVLIALRAIVYQIATDDEIYCMHAAEICGRSPSHVLATRETVWNDFLAGATSENRLFLVLDGIDEAGREEFEKFLHLLSGSALQSLRIQILLVGRPEMNSIIKGKLVNLLFETIEVSSQVNSKDIRKFSEARYAEYIKVRKTSESLRRKVITTLTNKANGMFIWVDLIYKEVLKRILTPNQLENALGHLPESTLNGLYDSIFLRVERDNGATERLALRELFYWTAYFKEPLSLFYLNHIMRFSNSNQILDVEAILEEACASLFVLVKTGEVLLDELNRSEAEMKGVADDAGEIAGQKELGDNAEAKPEDEDKDYDEDYDEDEGYNEDENSDKDEKYELEEEHHNRQREIFVHLRHASLGDYLRRSDLKPSSILLRALDGEVHVILTTLQIICKGADAPQDLWLFLMANFLHQLRLLHGKNILETDTKLIVGYLYDIFTSETLGKYIAEICPTSTGFGVDGSSFSFGRNTDLQNENRRTIQQWLQKAQDMTLVNLNSEVSNWARLVLEDPLELLVPLAKLCISEWLACNGPCDELFLRFLFAWRCFFSTELVPPFEIGRNTELSCISAWRLILGCEPFILAADILKQERTAETHLAIAKTMSYETANIQIGFDKVLSREYLIASTIYQNTSAEYQKAIEMAKKQGSNEMLKEVYLQQILAFANVRWMKCTNDTSAHIENYLTLDRSNARVFACRGVACFQNGDNEGAIEAFQKSLELNERDSDVGIALLIAMLKMKGFDGVMSQIEHHGHLAVGFWLRDRISDIGEHERVFYAARVTNKIEVLIKCYEHEIQNIQLSEEDIKAIDDTNPTKRASLALKIRTERIAVSSFFRVYLGFFYLKFLGQPDEALKLWKTAFFQQSEFFNLGSLLDITFSDDIIPYFFGLFSQLIYEKALVLDPEVAGQMLSLLENLRQREKAFRKLNAHRFTDLCNIADLINIDQHLAKLYLKTGRKEEAQPMLNEQFKRAIILVQGQIGRGDRRCSSSLFKGYGTLARLLFLNGQLEKAKIAVSLKRFSYLGFKGVAEDEAKGWFREVCTGSYACEIGSYCTSEVYTCTTCINVAFCESCYNNLRNETGKERLYVCNPSHDLLKCPMEGLEQITEETITVNGKCVSLVNWLKEVRREWKTGFCFKS